MTELTLAVHNVWSELQKYLIENETISVIDAVALTGTSPRNIPKVYKIETGELLILLDQWGRAARFSGPGNSGQTFARSRGMKTAVLKEFVQNLRRWEDGTVESAESDLAIATRDLIDRAI